MYSMPDITDDERLWDQADEIGEEEEVLTALEKRLEWICDEWEAAREADHYDNWHDIKMMLHGASMALIRCFGHFDDRQAIGLLSRMAFEYSLDCIARGKYEGAK